MASSFIEELKRRNVFKVTTGYLLLGWIVMQVADVMVPALGLPEWTITFLVAVGLLGFPFVVFFAWAFELTPEGIKRDYEVDHRQSITHQTGQKLNYFIIGLLVLALAYFIYESRFSPSTIENESLNQDQLSEKTQQASSENIQVEGSSIAVLPFVNMSSDPEQEYFSDGISEEILNLLAQIPNLKVTSRSSSFFYKGKDIKLLDVAQELGVANILEGSVRKSGNKLRITAQLIEASTDTHLWSETFDREIDDIFKIQDEISSAIVTVLKNKLDVDSTEVKRDMAGINLEAYNENLKGRALIQKRNINDLEQALVHFDRAIELSPNFADAWIGKAWAINFLSESGYGDRPNELSINEALPIINRALELAPESSLAYTIKGSTISLGGRNNAQSIALLEKAIKLNANNAYALTILANRVAFLNPTRSYSLRKQALALDPNSIIALYNYARDLTVYGQLDQAVALYERIKIIQPESHLGYLGLGEIYRLRGQLAESLIEYEKSVQLSPQRGLLKFSVSRIYFALGLKDQAKDTIRDVFLAPYRHVYENNLEQHLIEVQQVFPRTEQDSYGNFVRGWAEFSNANYNEAARYFKLATGYADYEMVRLYSYIESDEAYGLEQLQLKKQRFQNAVSNGEMYYYERHNEAELLEIALLEKDADQAIYYYKQLVNKKQPIDPEILYFKPYQFIREHPQWPSLIKRHKAIMAEERERYLSLTRTATVF